MSDREFRTYCDRIAHARHRERLARAKRRAAMKAKRKARS